MTGLQTSLYSVAMALCVFSAGLLRGRSERGITWLTAFLAIATAAFGLELMMAHPSMPLKALWLGLRMGLALLIAPCLWLVVRESVEGVRPKLSGLGWKHRIPVFAGMALLLPLVASAHLGLGYTRPPGADRPLHFMIHETMLLCIGIFAVQVPYYLWQCRRLLVAEKGSFTWLQLPLLVVLTSWALGLMRTLQCIGHAPQELSLLFALADVGVTIGAIYLIVRRGTVPSQGIEPAAVALSPSASADAESTAPVPAEPKYARSSLDSATSERIRRKLEAALATPEICRDSLLNLRSLSRGIGEKTHYVSQVINRDLHSNFYALVNRHRIARAKELLAESPAQTVLEIALAVGFNSKSTFNTAFRRETGMTPTAFRAGLEKP